MDFVCELYIYFGRDLFSCELRLAYKRHDSANEDKYYSVANFDIHDENNSAQRWKKWKQIFEFYLPASGTDNDS